MAAERKRPPAPRQQKRLDAPEAKVEARLELEGRGWLDTAEAIAKLTAYAHDELDLAVLNAHIHSGGRA